MVLHGPSAPPTRVAQACVPCHRTKTRCDGQQPTCSTCNDKGKSCEWPQPRGGSKSLTDRSSSSPSSSSGLQTSGCTPPSSSMALPDHGGHPTTAPSMQHQHQHPQHPPTGMTTTSHAMMSAGPMPMTTMSDTLDFTTPGSILDEAMRLQLQSIYFTKFHPQWPLLHRETFETTAQPKLLMQAVMTVGLWFASWPDARNLAIKFHDSLLVETGNKLVSWFCCLSFTRLCDFLGSFTGILALGRGTLPDTRTFVVVFGKSFGKKSLLLIADTA